MAHTEDLNVSGPLTRNKLTGDNATFAATTGTWAATNSVLSVDFDFKKYTSLNSLKITPTDYSAIVLTHSDADTTLEEARDNIDFHCWMFPTNDCLVTIELRLGTEFLETRTVSLAGGVWSILRAKPVDVPVSSETYPIIISITIANHGGQSIHLSNPTLYQEFRFTKNRFLQECVPLTPRIFTDIDKQQTFPSFPMNRMMEIGLANAGAAFQQQEHFRYRDISAGGDVTDPDTQSGLVNPDVADVQYLPWLSQFTGTQYIDPTLRTTPWGNLPLSWEEIMEDIDPAGGESPIAVINPGFIQVTSNASVFNVGDSVVINGTVNYNGTYTVTDVDGNILLTSPSTGLSNWSQFGNPIEGSAGWQDNFSLNGVVASHDGSTIVASSSETMSSVNGLYGLVRVYSKTTTGWIQKGSDIVNTVADQGFGAKLAINGDGTILAVLELATNNFYFYDWNGSDWVRRSEILDLDFLGSIAMSYDGNRVAVGNPVNPGSFVDVYDWNGSAWTIVGARLNPDQSTSRMGSGLSITPNGNTLAVGFSNYQTTTAPIYTGAGAVRVYDWNGTAWQPRGAYITGTSNSQGLGSGVEISDDGNTFITATNPVSSVFFLGGSAKAYTWNGTTWVQKGSTFNAIQENQYLGSGISINTDGTVIGLGSWGANRADLYRFNGTSWFLEQTFSGTGDFGRSMAMSSTGSTLIVAAPFYGADYRGRIHMYQLDSSPAEYVGEVSVVDQSWIELEAFRLDITNRVEFLRWQVRTQFYGLRAGTLEALSEATKFYLTGNKTVNIFPKHQGVPFLIKIFTKTSETPGGVEGQESAELVQALQAAKPAGFKIVHECNSAGTDNIFVLGSSTDGLLSSSLL